MLGLGAAAVLLIVGRVLAGVYADYLWYDSLGAVSLWQARLAALTWLRLGSAAAAGLFAFANLLAVRRSVVSLVFPRRVGNLEIGEEVPGRYLMAVVIGLSVVLGVLLALPQDDWMGVILARSGRMFNETDPYFGADLGFFVYWLPFESTLWTWAFYTVIVISISVVLLYALTPSLKWQRGGIHATTYVRRHFTVLIGVFLLMLAWSFRLDMYSLLVDGSGADGAFSYVDHHVGVPGDLVLALVTLGAALIVIWSGAVGQFRRAGISVVTVVVMSLLVREVAPFIIEHGGIEASRAAREKPYLATRAGYTRRAFAADAVTRADTSIAFPTLAAAIPWVPAWDPPALALALEAVRPSGGTSGAPAANDIPLVWYSSPAGLIGELVQPPAQGAAVHAPWTVTRVLAAAADERGAPVRLGGSDTTEADDAAIDPPLVYPDATPFAIIPDSLNHTTGTPLDSFINRLASAWSVQNFRILTAELPEPRPTMVLHRDVRERVGLYAPFFTQGHRVEPLLLGDTLYWAVDLYSASDTYPLSRSAVMLGEERSYLHHAAVAIVQASTGETVVVPDSTLDPIAATWVRRLPGVFGSWSALPAGLAPLLPPAVDGIYAQADAFGRYGTRADGTLPRHVAAIDGADSTLASDDLPLVLPGGRATALTLPLVDDSDRLRGLLIGRGGASRSTAWYALAAPGPRWSAILDRLRSVDSAGGAGSAAREVALTRGRVRAIPVIGTAGGVGDSSAGAARIDFMQPTYRSRGQGLPALNRVALLSGDSARSVMPPNGIVASAASPATPGETTPTPTFRASVAALYAAMRDAMKRGDWVAFGRAFNQLGHLLSGAVP